MKFTWLTLSGNPSISDKTITFHPSKTEGDNALELENQQSQNLRSNFYFQDGEIEFDVMISKPRDKVQLLLGSDGPEPLNVGINSNVAAYAIAKFVNGKYESLSTNGIGVEIVQNDWINILIKRNGSEITMYVNGIKACQASAYIHNSQIGLLYRGIGEAVIRNFSVRSEKPNAFIVMQFTDEYNTLYNEIIKPICEDYGFNVVRADNMYTNTLLIQDITSAIRESSLVLADITPDNPNVYYEVGFSHALEKPTILLCDRVRTKLPFDISSFRCIFYENSISGKTKVENVLKKHLDAIK